MKKLSLCSILFLLLATSCHKSNSTNSPGLAGQWKWVELDWHFGGGGGIIYPGGDSLVILTLKTSSTYTLQLNGLTKSAGTWLVTMKGLNNNDSTLELSNASSFSIVSDWAIMPTEQLQIQSDTMVLTFWSETPAGAGSAYKFIPYP